MLDPVDDLDVGAVDPHADVARLEPSVLGEGLGRRLGLVPVAGEVRGVLRLDLPGLLVDPQPIDVVGLADGAQLDPPSKLQVATAVFSVMPYSS